MKVTVKIILLMFIMAITAAAAEAQKSAADSTGLPGDHFSLQGALQLFKKASTPEEFEKLLNTRDNHVNNLDLNQDGKTDYVKVIDKSEKKLHAFVLQVPVSQKESQDIAVIALEKTGDTTAIVQVIGDKDIYGKEIIIEPEGAEKEPSSISREPVNQHGPLAGIFPDEYTVVVVNVWAWPSVRYVYGPLYTVWVSPWRWGYYPAWWTAWRPLSWYAWYPYCGVYSHGFVAVNTCRVSGVRYLYTPYRTSAVSVSRQGGVVAGPNGVGAGVKTTVTGPAGRSATRTTVVGAGRNGVRGGTIIRRGG